MRITATLLLRFDATHTGKGIELQWSFGTPDRVRSVIAERSESAAGVWTTAPLVEKHEEAGTTVALDRSVDPGRVYFYRLVSTLADGTTAIFGPILASTAEALNKSAITNLAPNPSGGATQIEFSIGRGDACALR